MNNYRFKLTFPAKKTPESVKDMLADLFIQRKWRHFLRVEKNVLVNGRYRNFNEQVKPGDEIKLTLTHVDSRQQNYAPSGHLPRVVFEDDNILVIDKPAGQKTHPNLFETDTALNDCATYLGFSPFVVHRLDMLTRGLLLVAKNPAAVPILNQQLSRKICQRDYLAWVTASPDLPDQGTIDKPIGQDPTDQRKRMVVATGLHAVTHFKVLKKDHEQALLALRLETGRTHQIRVHLASCGWPIIGDPLYNLAFKKGQDLQLTAFRLKLILPFSFQQKTIVLPK
jgi:23S rRNA pseudouridine1911/1915/1917 synthase